VEKKNKFLAFLTIILICLFSFCYFIYSNYRNAISKTEEFCERFNIACEGKPSVRFLLSNHYPTGTTTLGAKPSAMDTLVRFHKKDAYINFIVGRESGEIELYYNIWIKNRFKEKYNERKATKYSRGRINLPRFLSKKEAEDIIKAIIPKLEIPSDMTFNRMDKDEKEGLWNAYFIREKDGYRYREDKIVISIIGATGDFVGYTKTYKGKPCPTQVNVNKDSAVELGWSKLQQNISVNLQKKLKEIYKVTTELLIVQVRDFPFIEDKSRLAWVVKYNFTGEISDEIRLELLHNYSEETNGPIPALVGKRYKEWRKMGQPPWSFEIQIDAATGKEIYVSSEMPTWVKWLTR